MRAGGGREIRRGRPSDFCGSCAGEAGWWRTGGCYRAATATRCRPTRTPTRSASGWRVRDNAAEHRVRARTTRSTRSGRGARGNGKTMKMPLVSFALLLGSAMPATAQPQTPAGPAALVTAGEGMVKQAPDRAWVTIAAGSRARAAEGAQRPNNQAMTAVGEKIQAG